MRLLVVLFLFITTISWAQKNQTDARGMRQGLWEKRGFDGKLIYKGSFKDDKPVGEWLRYHKNGSVKAKMEYRTNSDSVHAQLFDERGKKVAEGSYIEQSKEGSWKYYSDGKLVSREGFRNGVKNGISTTYYPSGEVMERCEWLNGMKEGKYETFFKNGKPYLQCKMKQDMRHGICLVSSQKGMPELEAEYQNNLRHGSWKYFDDKGELNYTLVYSNGELQNPKVKDSISALRLEHYEKGKDKIPDPEKFMDDPSEYMRSMKIY